MIRIGDLVEQHPVPFIGLAIAAGLIYRSHLVRAAAIAKQAAQNASLTPGAPGIAPPRFVATTTGQYTDVWGQQPGNAYVSPDQLNQAMANLREQILNQMGYAASQSGPPTYITSDYGTGPDAGNVE